MNPLEGIIKTLTDTYQGKPWHGPSVKQVLSQITPEMANHRIGTGHSIIELVLHMVAWRNFVIHKLQGDEAFDVSEADNFPPSTTWQTALEELEKNQAALLGALRAWDMEKLENPVPPRNYSYYKLLHGIVHHDLYHLGQIVMITKQF
ncbi:MAG TPA: DinB family protein [Cytophagales bacterium]|nr:DinB family protein [Cytophagales bacterium]HCR54291.1 DinB family protein [Cytophagales bacterium]